jgi:hypothetical protein
MPVQGAVCPTLFGVVCSYIFLFALKGAFEELKLYGSPSLAEVQCDNSFHVSTILTLLHLTQNEIYCSSISYFRANIVRFDVSSALTLLDPFFFCYDPEQLDKHVQTFWMKTLQPFSGLLLLFTTFSAR